MYYENLFHNLRWFDLILYYNFVLPSSQIISHSKNFGDSKHLKYDQIYMIK
jgi:hypothetical protein